MCTPKGSAFLFASSTFKDTLSPLVVSWGSLIPTAGDGFFIDEHEFLGTRDYSPFLTVPFGLDWMRSNDWPLVQQRCRLLKSWAINKLCQIDGVTPLLKEFSDPNTQLGAVLLPYNLMNMGHMKDWLYDEKRVEVVVHKALGHNILRFSVHAHTSEGDIRAMEEAVREYLGRFSQKQGEGKL